MVGKQQMATAKKKKEIECDLVRGEEIRFIVDYDLYGHNLNGLVGLVVREDSGNGKPLVYVEEADGEWIEPETELYDRVDPGIVPANRLKFLQTVRKMGEL